LTANLRPALESEAGLPSMKMEKVARRVAPWAIWKVDRDVGHAVPNKYAP